MFSSKILVAVAVAAAVVCPTDAFAPGKSVFQMSLCCRGWKTSIFVGRCVVWQERRLRTCFGVPRGVSLRVREDECAFCGNVADEKFYPGPACLGLRTSRNAPAACSVKMQDDSVASILARVKVKQA